MSSENQIKNLNDQTPYDFKDDLQNLIREIAEMTTKDLINFAEKVIPDSDSEKSKIIDLFIRHNLEELENSLNTAGLKFSKNSLKCESKPLINTLLQNTKHQFEEFVKNCKSAYGKDADCVLMRYFIEKYIPQELELSGIFNEKEANEIVQKAFSSILETTKFQISKETKKSILKTLESLKKPESELNLKKESKIKAITIQPKPPQFSLYTPIKKLHQKSRFNDEHDPTKLTIMHINIRKLETNFEAFRFNLTLFKRLPDVIGITETHYSHDQSNESSQNYKIPHFKLYIPENHKSEKERGVAMYVNENFKAEEIQDLSLWDEDVYESMFLEINTSASSFVCGVIYKPQFTSNPKFRPKLKNLLAEITRENKTAAICGDFNTDLLEQAQEVALKDFKMVMVKHNYVPCIIRPTRYEPQRASSSSDSGSRTLIDHIWFNKAELVSNSAILVDYFGSDHLAVCCSVKIDQPPSKTQNKFSRTLQIKDKDIKNILEKSQQELADRYLNYLVSPTKVSKSEVNNFFPTFLKKIPKQQLF